MILSPDAEEENMDRFRVNTPWPSMAYGHSIPENLAIPISEYTNLLDHPKVAMGIFEELAAGSGRSKNDQT